MNTKIRKFPHFDTMKQMLKSNAQQYSSAVAFELDVNKTITYEKFHQDVTAIGSALIGRYNLRGKKIAVSGKNSYQWCCAYHAVIGGVGVITPIDRELPNEEILNLIEFAEIKAIFADKSVTKKLLKIADKLPKDFLIITTDESVEHELVISHSEVLSGGEELIYAGYNEYGHIEIDPKALAVILFTSGTTGLSKGVMLSNENLCSDILAVSQIVSLTTNDKILSFLPMHHAYEAITVLMTLWGGGTVAFSGGLRHITNDFKKFKPTIFVCVPLLIEKMHAKIMANLKSTNKLKKAKLTMKASPLLGDKIVKNIFAEIHEIFGGNLKMIIVGAASLNEQVSKDMAAFGVPIVSGYGLTECSPIVICNHQNHITHDSIGKPLSSVTAKIINEDENGIGEICVKGPMIMLGYYKNIQETEKVLKDGWFKTGDLGFKDKNGFYHITGRIKNVIVTKNGKNIYPEELEYYLNNDPMILESLIFSDGSCTEGEKVQAKVVADTDAIKQKLQKDELTKEDVSEVVHEVVRNVNKKLPSYKTIKEVEIKEDGFEKTTTHKIKRHIELKKDEDKKAE